MNIRDIQSKNERYHIIEGALYISTAALIPAQTLMPALIKRLGGSDVLVGSWPVVVYLAFFFPQIISANYHSASQYRKPIVMRLGFIQRLHILLIGCVIAIWGISSPSLALALMFVLYISNQATSGTVSPIWMDFFAKTTSSNRKGKLMGWRATYAASLGLLNAFVLTILLTILNFPYNYAAVIILAAMYQMSSLYVQNKIIEEIPSAVSVPVGFKDLLINIRSIVISNKIFRKFLIASSLLTLSFSSVAFFTVAAMERFGLSESIVGIFTILTIVGQILSGGILGWVADNNGTKAALLICAVSLFLSIFIALIAPSVEWFYFVFVFFGINSGAEIFMRYNFAVECASEQERPMYIGIMNAWFAPFYIVAPFIGWLSAHYGYKFIFTICLVISLIGIVLLARTSNPRSK